MQFIAEVDRGRMIGTIHACLQEGGAFVLCEKVYSPDAKFQNMIDFMYLEYKRQFFSTKELIDKEKELRHLAKLKTEEQIIDELTSEGLFGDIQVFWRNFNFIGIVAIKKAI